MKRESNTGISFFQRYLTVWVIICMALGILIGKYLPGIPEFLNQFEYAKVSIPMAILIWLMIYPMMMKVDFQSIKNVGKNPKGLFVTWITNWLIKPFTMYGIASLFFFVIFKAFITPELATEYPKDYADAANLAELATWLKSTDQSAATGDNLLVSRTYDGVLYTQDTAEYRLAKFKSEFAQHFEKDAVLFYYLFTELFLMVDSRAKNMFPTFMSGSKWFSLPYDFDTAIGINNEGALVFSYNLEDIDHTESGADIYNGQQSVLWINVRAAFYEDIKAMYQKLRSGGTLSFAVTEQRFEEHQAKWPEAVFNEDAYFKYLQPLVEQNTASYLSMLQGSKAEQRKWWLYNRFRYLDSKYNAGDALTDVVTLRGYAKDDITVTPYADIYASIKYGSYLVQQRANRNVAYTLACPLSNVNDTEIYIYSASQLQSIGDLSGLMVGYADFSMATRLQSLKVGDAEDSYSNGNLTELYLGNNTLLRTLDGVATNEFYRVYEVKPCRQIDYGLYVANFKTAYDGMRLSMNLYAMDGVMIFIKDDKTTAEPTENNTDQ